MALEACREEIRPGIEPWGNPRLTLYHVESYPLREDLWLAASADAGSIQKQGHEFFLYGEGGVLRHLRSVLLLTAAGGYPYWWMTQVSEFASDFRKRETPFIQS
ncbi:uncharacterized protein H6S33_002228 [Morchella sextelata]|uniref:uncharacterized protein n=1 Tax=Morchella sextelata TaxID=1174677 RepID=UPI001D043D4A|nr:uncharacterized protein H6S33_002228 [Morchella sextelata]KAH0608176.1 hypothetical protein H6S33_002228 [Morchella sextelata]